jgi:hypothetical protein
MLSAILVMTSMSNAYAGIPPNADPLGCDVNGVEQELTVMSKAVQGAPMIVTWEIENPDDPEDPGSHCNFELVSAEVTWPDGTIATSATCNNTLVLEAGDPAVVCQDWQPPYFADTADQAPPGIWVTDVDFLGVVKTDPIDSNVQVLQDFPIAEEDVSVTLDKVGPVKVLVDDTFVYTYTAENTGDTDVICSLTDAIQPGDNPVVGIENNGKDPANFVLEAGQTEVFDSVLQSHSEPGTVDDLARLNCSVQDILDLPEETAPWSVEVVRLGLSMSVTCDPADQIDDANNSIDWTIEVTNDGSIDQSGINLVNNIPNCVLDAPFDGTVEAGVTDTLTCTVGPDLGPGNFAGSASVNALAQEETVELGAQDGDDCDVTPAGVTLLKEGPEKVLVDDTFVYTYTAENTGDADLICTLTDAIQPGDNPVVGIENNPKDPASFALDAGQLEFFDSVVQTHSETGVVEDLARLNCDFADGTGSLPEETSPWAVNIEKSELTMSVECAPETQEDSANNSIVWTIMVNNVGSVDQSGINLVNNIPNCTLDAPFDGTVEAGNTDTLTCTVGPDLGPGGYAGAASINAIDQNRNTLEDNGADECEVTGGSAGCTPGFWKNNADKQDYAAWPASAISDFSFFSVFDRNITIDVKGKDSTIVGPTLEEALGATGGDINALARHGVAAYLNSIDAEVDYPFSSAAVIELVQDEIDAGTYDHSALADANELGCTQNQQGDPIELEE